MKNFKKVAAMGLAATMLMGSAATAFATEGGATGSGDYEGYVEETSVFSVNVPTDASATQGFDFFVDPNGLLAATDYARIPGATAADFEADATLFFTRTPVAADADNGVEAVTKYGKDSESITFTNMSSYAVDVEVSAAVSGVDGITLGTVGADTTAPTIYLALVAPGTDGNDATTPITASGAAVTGSIDGENSNFEVVYKEADADAGTEAGYYYVQKTPTDDDPLAPWKTYAFNITGACGGTWTSDQAEVAPEVTLTWKVTDPVANAAPSIATKSYTMVSGTTIDIAVDLGAGDKAAATVSKVMDPSGVWDYLAHGDATYDSSAKKVTLTAKMVNDCISANVSSVNIVFDEGTSIAITLTK